MYRIYQKLISLAVLVSFSVLFVCGGYAAAPTVKLVIDPDTTEVSVGADPIAIVSHASGSNLTYTWKLLGPGRIEGEGPAVFYHVPDTLEKESARVIITATVTDGEGQQTTETAIFTIRVGQVKERPPTPGTAAKTTSPEPSQEDTTKAEPKSKGMSKRTKIILGGVVTAATIGGGVALLAGGGDDDDGKGGPFSGTFRLEYTGQLETGEQTFNIMEATLIQDGNSITGTVTWTSTLPGWCTASVTVPISGTATGMSAVLTDGSGESRCQSPDGGIYHITYNGSTYTVELINNGNTLRVVGGRDYPRIAKVSDAEISNKIYYRLLRIGGDFIRQ